ncbi:hypothetical protein GOODEAATRI_013160 [Goodea atripinnis]|uniref:Apoptosis regulator Bcl-2 family BH4 domain-containing protein n=1 Tax=Goodea atripinnis TaxID=208336 RepID=A0ABV0MKB8_9TELE
MGRWNNSRDTLDYTADPREVRLSLTQIPLQQDMDVLRRSSMFASEVLDVFDRSLTEKELASQSKALCRDYILSRLNQNGLGWSKTEMNFSPPNAALAEVSLVLLCLGEREFLIKRNLCFKSGYL